ncbi:MAG: amidohydrolase family protein, partial [Pseudorhodoplanes sp.]
MMSMAKRVFVGGVLALACRGLWAQERLVGARDTQPAKATLAIVGGTLIDGHEGQPQSHAVVLVDGNRVAAVGTRDTLRVPPGTQIVDAAGMTVMPGLIDAHVHLDLLGHGDYARWHRLYTPRYTEIIATAARLAIMSGVTTVVDMFGPPDPLLAVRQKVDRGEIPGPRMKLSLGAILNSERGYVGRESYSWQVKTAEDARVTTQKLIGMGADIINAMDGLTADQIRAIAAEARKAGVKVTGIASSPQDLIMRIKAGQQALDHLNGLNGAASSLDGESLQVLFDARASVVPTLVQSTMIQLRASETPEYFV